MLTGKLIQVTFSQMELQMWEQKAVCIVTPGQWKEAVLTPAWLALSP